MKKIIFAAHCILNTASKVVLYNQEEIDAEEALRKEFMHKVIEQNVQVIQLPCPEFTLYGARRWGHVSDQFDNVFFREHCRNILSPIISPSCGADYTCRGNWYGSFEGRENLDETLADCQLEKGHGVMIAVLKEMLEEEGLSDRIKVTALFAPEPRKCLELLEGAVH